MPQTGKTAMSASDLKRFKTLLEKRRNELKGTVDTIGDKAIGKNPTSESGEMSSIPIHLADVGSDVFEHDLNLNLVERGSQELFEIEEALQKVEAGKYGLCERCTRPISRERLSALPHARLCVDCKRAEEKA